MIYDFNDQIVNHVYTNNWMEPRVTGNHAGSKREEKGAIKKLLNNYTFLLPVHDRPAKIQNQQVVGRLGMSVPGPMTETLPEPSMVRNVWRKFCGAHFGAPQPGKSVEWFWRNSWAMKSSIRNSWI